MASRLVNDFEVRWMVSRLDEGKEERSGVDLVAVVEVEDEGGRW